MTDHTTTAARRTETQHFLQDVVAAARTVHDTQPAYLSYCWLLVLLRSANCNDHNSHTMHLHTHTPAAVSAHTENTYYMQIVFNSAKYFYVK